MVEALTQIDWREPLWLWLGLFPVLLWTARGLLQRPRGTDYADAHLLPWVRARSRHGFEPKRLWRHALLAAAWLLFAAALAGPRIAETRYGLDAAHTPELMVVLDLSRSMTARDIAPTRLERAKLELHDLLARAEGLKIGLVVYAGRPHLMVPPTEDTSALRHYLQILEHGLLPTEGSNLRDALALAGDSFISAAAPHALLLVTDGEVPSEAATAAAALEDVIGGLRERGVTLYALGMGTREGTALLAPQGGWLRRDGQAVESSLHEARLRELATQGNGRYATVSDTDSEWQRLYDAGIRRLHSAAASAGAPDQLIVWHELYAWLLAPAALLMLLAHVRTGRGLRAPATVTPSLVLLVSALACSTAAAPPAHAADARWQEEAYQAYLDQAYQEARRLYSRVPGYAGRMGEAASAYRLGEYQHAIQLFTQATLDAEDDAQRARALLNLANSHYRIEDYLSAEQLYRDVLRYQADNRAAAVNLGYAVAMREQQEQEQTDQGDPGGAARQGRGARTATAPQGTEVSGGLRVSEDEPPPRQDESSGEATPREPGSPTRRFEASRPAVSEAAEFDDPGWRYDPTSPNRIMLQADSLEADPRVLWKRLFEAAEGFYAPAERPQALPDTPPW